MNETMPPSADLSLNCALCGCSFSASQMGLRGKLNFCQVCATERSAECLVHLGGTPKKSPWPVAALAVIGLGCIVIGVWGAVKVLAPGTAKVAASENVIATPSTTSIRPEAPAAPSATSAPPATPTAAAVANTASTPEATPASTNADGKETKDKTAAPQRTNRSVEDVGNIHLLFVTRPETDSRMGLASSLFITREAPNETSAKLTTEVGKQMATSFEEGLRYVQKQPRAWEREFSIRLSFEDKFTSKDGGSAGTGFTIAMLAAIENIPLDPTVAVTGDLTVDGTVQPVGAVVEKLRGAIDSKCKITLIPERNSRDVIDLALLDGSSPLWQTQVFSVRTIDEALGLARKDRADNLQSAIARFDALRARLPAVVTANYLQSPIVQSELKEVLRAAPNHLSASILLQAAIYQLPRELSLNRSVDEIMVASYLFVSDILAPQEATAQSSSMPNRGVTTFPEREFNTCLGTLQRMTPILDHRSQELRMSCIAYASALRSAFTYQPPDLKAVRTRQQITEVARRESLFIQEAKNDVDERRSNLLLALRKLDTDGSLMAELRKK
jgi:hypothetical protein